MEVTQERALYILIIQYNTGYATRHKQQARSKKQRNFAKKKEVYSFMLIFYSMNNIEGKEKETNKIKKDKCQNTFNKNVIFILRQSIKSRCAHLVWVHLINLSLSVNVIT